MKLPTDLISSYGSFNEIGEQSFDCENKDFADVEFDKEELDWR